MSEMIEHMNEYYVAKIRQVWCAKSEFEYHEHEPRTQNTGPCEELLLDGARWTQRQGH